MLWKESNKPVFLNLIVGPKHDKRILLKTLRMKNNEGLSQKPK